MHPDDVGRWFSGSRVRRTDRAPLVLWHATPHEFERFDVGMSRDIGVHFGSRLQAEHRARASAREHRFVAALLRVVNPLVLTGDPRGWLPHNLVEDLAPAIGAAEAERLRARIGARVAEDRAAMAAWRRENPGATPARARRAWEEAGQTSQRRLLGEMRALLESSGYDGIAYPNLYERPSVHETRLVEHSWVVFSPDQILVLPEARLPEAWAARLARTPGGTAPGPVAWVPVNRLKPSDFGDPSDPVLPLVRGVPKLPPAVQRVLVDAMDAGLRDLGFERVRVPGETGAFSVFSCETTGLRAVVAAHTGHVNWLPRGGQDRPPEGNHPAAGTACWRPQIPCSLFVHETLGRVEAAAHAIRMEEGASPSPRGF